MMMVASTGHAVHNTRRAKFHHSLRQKVSDSNEQGCQSPLALLSRSQGFASDEVGLCAELAAWIAREVLIDFGHRRVWRTPAQLSPCAIEKIDLFANRSRPSRFRGGGCRRCRAERRSCGKPPRSCRGPCFGQNGCWCGLRSPRQRGLIWRSRHRCGTCLCWDKGEFSHALRGLATSASHRRSGADGR